MSTPRLDHGAIGNGRILGLVSPTSAVEWLCLPRFDSPSVFARILDTARGGTFRILFDGEEIRGSLGYLRNTNVLHTRFEAGDAAWEVIDFAPRIPDGLRVRAPARLVRLLRPLRGAPRLRADFDPRPEYGAVKPELWERGHGLEVRWPGGSLTLRTSLPTSYVLGRQPFQLDREHYFAIDWGPPDEGVTLESLRRDLDLTVAGLVRDLRLGRLPGDRQDALLGIMQVVEAEGCGFAFPTRTVHVRAERSDEHPT